MFILQEEPFSITLKTQISLLNENVFQNILKGSRLSELLHSLQKANSILILAVHLSIIFTVKYTSDQMVDLSKLHL